MEITQSCYVCKTEFVCPCWNQKGRLKDRCCSNGLVKHISRMYNCPDGHIRHIHLCSKPCQLKLPDPFEHLKFQCSYCQNATYSKYGKEDAAKQHQKCKPIKKNQQKNYKPSQKEFSGNCYECGKLIYEPKNCSRCGVTYYCSVQCQKKDWKRHREFHCRPEGKNLVNFTTIGMQQIPYLLSKKHRAPIQRSISECVRKQLKKETNEDVPLYCIVCGDLQPLGKMNGVTICKECFNIQINM